MNLEKKLKFEAKQRGYTTTKEFMEQDPEVYEKVRFEILRDDGDEVGLW